MAIKYKQKCSRCKKNYVIVTYKQRYQLCYDCQKSEMKGKIEDPKMKKLLTIPEEFYQKNAFLRNIKINYLKYRNLTDKQVEAFKKAVKKLEEESNQ